MVVLGSMLVFIQFVLMGKFILICALVGMWTLRLLDSISWFDGLLVSLGIHMSALHCRWSLSGNAGWRCAGSDLFS
jgi:hypothetical protein